MIELRLDRVQYSYSTGTQALNGITLHVKESEIVLITGRNGSGKTTLLKHLNGLLKPDHGTVIVNGIDTRTADVVSLAQFVALAFQNPDDQIFCNTVFEEVSFGPKNLSRANYERLVNSSLELTNLSSRARDNPYDLHPLERRWVSIASVLAMNTPCLALDEPTADMGYDEKLRLREILTQEKAKNKTILVSSHDINFFLPICDRIILLSTGNVLFDGPPARLLARQDVRTLCRCSGIAFPLIPRISKALGLSLTIYQTKDFLDQLFSSK
ncbi:energy-coupling factor ABC transporter ATP-binding protein [Acidobacteria bacterium AH-259-G07]|nr:energy-coupling factor ABC transporter ATP-binding protein [Acidobacteria bacterium AH-259-G07]